MFGYKLLFVILLAGLGAARESSRRSSSVIPSSSWLHDGVKARMGTIADLYNPFPPLRANKVLQVLSLRLGTTTSLSLPAQIRALFLRMRDHPKISPYRWRRNMIMGGLYTLYGLAEVAIVATDLAELLGSAIALNL